MARITVAIWLKEAGVRLSEIAARLVVIRMSRGDGAAIGRRLYDDGENRIVSRPPEVGRHSRIPSMTLAPIRGAPPGAPNPDFPIEEPKAKPPQSTPAASPR